MPHPKNRLKLTGDTHLHDPRFDYMPDDDASLEMLTVEEEQVLAPRVYADGFVPSATDESEPQSEPASGVAAKAVDKVAQVEARSPWLAIGAMLAFGWLVARMLR
jgi:hypothetical protein